MSESSYTPPVGAKFKFIDDLYLADYAGDVAEIVPFEIFQLGRNFQSVKELDSAFRDGEKLFATFFWSSPYRIKREPERPALAVINQYFHDCFFRSAICEKHFIEKS